MATIAHTTPLTTSRTAAAPRVPTAAAQESGEPSRAASILPVLVAFGALTTLIVGAAFFGGKLLTILGSVASGL